MKNLKLFVSSAFIALAFSSIQETQSMDSKDKEPPEKTQCSSQSEESVSEEPGLDEKIYIDGVMFDITKEFKKSARFTRYRIEIKKFNTFLEACGEDEPVLVFGTGHWYEKCNAKKFSGWEYPKNAYLADSLVGSRLEEAKPDLLMSVGINKVPIEYVGKFNIVIFEGISPNCYDPDKAFQNVNELLKVGGIFLVYLQKKYKETLYKPLINSGFSFSRVIKESFEYEPEQQYIGKWIELTGDEFYWVWKKERDII